MNIDSAKLRFELKEKHQLFNLLLSKSLVRKPGRDFKESSKRVWDGGLYLKSYIRSYADKHYFKNIESFCIFVGYSRSGHSIVGALLDAHPNIIISHEVGVLGFKEKKFSKDQIFSLILANSKQFTKTGRGWSGNSHQVSGQWQGNFTKLKVIGDKDGGWTSHLLIDNPNITCQLESLVGVDIKYIHHIRNPFDNISRMVLVLNRKKITKKHIDYYFSLVKANYALKKRLKGENYFEGKHEDFISNPERYLTRLCKFLNVSFSKSYLKACAGIVSRVPSKPRYKIIWDKRLIEYTTKLISKYNFLKGYKY